MAMTDRKDTTDDRSLELLFSSAKASGPEPDPSFLARLEADMEALRPTSESRPTDRQAGTFLPWIQRLFAASGLTGAAAIGVWIGFVMPETLNGVAETYIDDGTVGIEAFLPFDALAAFEE